MIKWKEYYLKNKEKEKERKKLYYKNNKEKVFNCCKKWKEKNKEKLRNYNKKRYQENKEHILNTCKKYRDDNKDVIRKKSSEIYKSKEYRTLHKKRMKDKYHNDPIQKLISLHRTRLWHALKSQNAKKSDHSIKLFGCSVKDLKNYLEKQFQEGWNWKNHGLIWHIDHIKPLSKFNLNDDVEQKKAFHFTNLQPLLKEENLRKHNN